MLFNFRDKVRAAVALKAEQLAQRQLKKRSLYAREDLKRNTQFFNYGEEALVEPTIDVCIGKQHPDFVKAAKPYKVEQPFVSTVHDVTLQTAFALPTTSTGQWIPDAMYNSEAELARALRASLFKRLKRGFHKRKKVHFSVATSLITHYSENYYHWMMDCLPRLEGIRQFEQRYHQKVTIIVEYPLPEYKRASLEMLGFGDRIFMWEDNMTAQCDTLVIPSFINVGDYVSPYSCRWLNKNLGNSLQETKADDAKLIYLSRAFAPSRRVENEGELVRHLEQLGATCVLPEKLTLSEQIRLFQNAKLIISPSGAALTNMAFSRNAYIVELFDYHYMTVSFMFQSRACNHSYNLIVGETSVKNGIHQMVIDLKDMMLMLEKTLPKILTVCAGVVLNAGYSLMVV